MACKCIEAQLPVSPVPDQRLQGYLDVVSAEGGDPINVMLGGLDGQTATIELVRLLHGDPNPAGPGYRAEAVDWGQPKLTQLRNQGIQFGSYVEIAGSHHLSPSAAFTISLWIKPTTLVTGWQALGAKWGPTGLSYGLFCGDTRFVTAAVSTDGVSASWCVGRDFVAVGSWQFLAMTYDSALGNISVYQYFPDRSQPPSVVVKSVSPGPTHENLSPLLFGALPCPRCGVGRWAHFNGKLSRPLLIDRMLHFDEITSLAVGDGPESRDAVLGAWDFGRAVSTTLVPDDSPFAHHGVAVNAPGRAVTGPGWCGEPSRLYSDDPDQYDAIHLHDDDLDDAGWDPTMTVRVRDEAASGVYALTACIDRDILYLPFVVRPVRATCNLAMMIPTLTWQAYGSNRLAYSHTEDGVLDRGLSIYDLHRDGSMVYYSTRRKPTRAGTPCSGFANWGAHTVAADLYTIYWLEEKSLPYDLYADQDLHDRGFALLAPYRCVIVSSHPEYYSHAMMTALRQYVDAGGRLVYLGGNGLYWVTSFDPARPHIMEVRKSEGQYQRWCHPEPGEWQHSTTLEVGGVWARRGLAPYSILGVGYAGNCTVLGDEPYEFERLPASWDDQYSFVFDGVAEQSFGGFGLNMGSAVGVELDAVREPDHYHGAPPVVLARARHRDFFPPDRDPVSPVADIAITAYPNGGAVFATGSITWSGSLSHNECDNSVSRITENVIKRFRDALPGSPVC
jgi:N,N-dimethylformamidase